MFVKVKTRIQRGGWVIPKCLLRNFIFLCLQNVDQRLEQIVGNHRFNPFFRTCSHIADSPASLQIVTKLTMTSYHCFSMKEKYIYNLRTSRLIGPLSDVINRWNCFRIPKSSTYCVCSSLPFTIFPNVRKAG